jgi:hypothetical protein
VATELFTNQASTTVTSGGTDAPASGTSETWSVAASTSFPAASSSATPPTQFHICDTATGKTSEIIAVTNVSGTTWTVTRGAESTTPIAHTAGFTVQQVVTAGYLTSVTDQASTAVDWVNVVTAGADPTGTTAVDTVVNGIITALGTHGGVVYFPAGTYKVSSGLVALLTGTQTVTIRGDGASATILSYYGSGDCIRMYNDQAYGSGGAQSYFSGILDLTVDGTNATGSPAGLHVGDISFLQIQGVIVQNFTGTSSTGVHMDNTTNWTEEGDYRIGVINCTRGVVLDVTTGTNSYGYSNFDLTFFQAGAQSCLCVIDGALLYHSFVKIRGDVEGSASSLTGNPAVIYLSGVGPDDSQSVGANPTITATKMDVLVEPNDNSGANPNLMQTIYLDTATFGIINECYGMMDFSQGTGEFAPIASAALTGSAGYFGNFSGIIVGDSNLNPTAIPTWQTWGSGTILNWLPGVTAFDGYFPTAETDTFTSTLDGTESIVYLNYEGIGNGDTVAAPQRKTMFIHQPSSGGPYNLTWPVNASPSNSAPTIWWPGGASPILQTAAGGTDVIGMVTYDGETWYGEQLASYGTAASQTVALAPPHQRVTLSSPFTSSTGTTAQTVTGMFGYVHAGTYRIEGWFPCVGAGGILSTQTLAWTFNGTASTAQVKWEAIVSGETASFTSAVSGTALTTSSAALTMSTSGIFAEFDAYAVITTPGTLQLTVKSGTSGDEITIPAGSYLDVQALL